MTELFFFYKFQTVVIILFPRKMYDNPNKVRLRMPTETASAPCERADQVVSGRELVWVPQKELEGPSPSAPRIRLSRAS